MVTSADLPNKNTSVRPTNHRHVLIQCSVCYSYYFWPPHQKERNSEVGDEGGGPAKLVWQFKRSIEDPCVVEGVAELHARVASIEASLARVEALLVVLVEDLEDRSRGFSRKRHRGLEAQGLIVELWEKRARKEEEEK